MVRNFEEQAMGWKALMQRCLVSKLLLLKSSRIVRNFVEQAKCWDDPTQRCPDQKLLFLLTDHGGRALASPRAVLRSARSTLHESCPNLLSCENVFREYGRLPIPHCIVLLQ